MKTKTGLENEYGQNVSLKSVHLEGKLEGLKGQTTPDQLSHDL